MELSAVCVDRFELSLLESFVERFVASVVERSELAVLVFDRFELSVLVLVRIELSFSEPVVDRLVELFDESEVLEVEVLPELLVFAAAVPVDPPVADALSTPAVAVELPAVV